MPINPNKDQQKACAFFHNSFFVGGHFKTPVHEGIVLREILTRFTVTERTFLAFIDKCYVKPGLLIKDGEYYQFPVNITLKVSD